MTLDDQIAAFELELDLLLHRYASEFELPLCVVVGVLSVAIQNVYEQNSEADETEDEV